MTSQKYILISFINLRYCFSLKAYITRFCCHFLRFHKFPIVEYIKLCLMKLRVLSKVHFLQVIISKNTRTVKKLPLRLVIIVEKAIVIVNHNQSCNHFSIPV